MGFAGRLRYTATTRGKKLAILVRPANAFGMALRNADSHQRLGCLRERLKLL